MNSLSRNYQEKRNFIRMKVDTPVSVKNPQGEHTSGRCLDLSGGGLLIAMSTAIPVGTQLEIAVSSHHGHSPMLRAMTKVCRVEAQPDTTSKPCRLGLEILAMID